MGINLNYNVSAHRVLHDQKMKDMLPIMRDTGVSTLWLFGYFYGRFESELSEIEKAKKYLESEGFEVNAISIPVGHPGNALDGDISSHTDLTIPDTWHYRVNGEGKNTYFCAAIDDVMIKDNAEAAKKLRDIGITKIFYDDDLRTSSSSSEIGGCFCEKCIEEFNSETGHNFDREILYGILTSDEGAEEIKEAWTDRNCRLVVKFLKEVTHEGLTSGIMIAQGGKRLSGTDIPLIKKEVPETFFRVGEGNFTDEKLNTEEGKKGLIKSLLTHKELIRDISKTYSETTVFPARALSPENLVEKMRIEIKCGLKNIYLMSGVWLIDEPYWEAIKKAMPELIALSEQY